MTENQLRELLGQLLTQRNELDRDIAEIRLELGDD